jgi:hypothetical protein
MRFQQTYAIRGDSYLGWWTGHAAAGQQVVAALGQDGTLFAILFDPQGQELRVQRFRNDLDEEPPVNHLFAPAAMERSLAAKFPGFRSGVVRVRPFWVDEQCNLELHPLPDWARPWIDGGYTLENGFQSAWSRQDLWDWLTEGCCQVEHSDWDGVCWYNSRAEQIG